MKKKLVALCLATGFALTLASCKHQKTKEEAVELTETSYGSGEMEGSIFYYLDIDTRYWREMESSERDDLAREIVSEYDEIAKQDGYDEERSIVTAYAGSGFAFGEEDLLDGYHITIFDSDSSDSARRIRLDN